MKTSVRQGLCISLCLFMLLSVSRGAAQDARGLITGIVSDATGAVVPGAKVTAIADATGVVTAAVSNESGNYALLYLLPGTYSVTVAHAGFSKLVRKNIEVRVGDELKLNLQLAVGSVQTEMSVTAAPPLIEAQSADVGVTMTNQQIADLPISDGNPFTLARLVPGAVFTGSPLYARPFDNSDVSAIRVNGAEGGINFTLNGAPNTGHQIGKGDPVLSFMPPAEAMQEFKMTTSTYSAQTGHTAAASVNVSTKSGGNKFHGGLYEQNRNEVFSAQNFFDANKGLPKPATRVNHFGGFVGGPIIIPKLYDGHKKSFFFFATDHMIDSFPGSKTTTVPTLGQKGLDANHKELPYFDFGFMCQSGFDSTGLCKDRASNGTTVLHQIYNPFTTVYQKGSTTNVTRNPFPYNQIPRALVSPIALKVINFYPDPNQTGYSDGTQNYYSPNPRNDWFHSYMGRVDHVLSSRQSLHGNYQQNWRWERRDNPFGIVTNSLLNVSTAPEGNNLYYVNHGLQVGDTITVSNTTVIDVRTGYSRFHDKRRPQVLGFDPTSLGLPAGPTDTVKAATGVQNFMPYFRIRTSNSGNANEYEPLGNTNSRYMDAISNTYYASVTFSTMHHSHMLTYGYDGRLLQQNSNSAGDAMGYYEFRDSYAEQTNKSSGEQGQALATFLLGLPYNNSSGIDLNDTSANSFLFHAAYIQDDWKLTPKVTLDLGIRYEYEGPPSERFNRNIRGFDLNTVSPMSAAAQAAFAQKFPTGTYTPSATACSSTGILCPISNIALPTFEAVGGYLFTDGGHHSFYRQDPYVFLPRFGIAYALTEKTVLRGGVGLYAVPFTGGGDNGSVGFNQKGFSQKTTAYTTQNNGMNLNPANCVSNPSLCPAGMATLSNPFPNGVTPPTGSGLGLETGMGGSVGFSPLNSNVHPKVGKSLAWSFDIQRELPGKWAVTLNYSGRRGWNLVRSSSYLNALPQQYFTTNPLNDANMQAWDAEMKLKVANPFQGLGPASLSQCTGICATTNGGFNNGLPTTTTIALSQLLRPYPQFSDITTGIYNGANYYHAGSVMLDHRFSHGYQVYFTYTFSKLMEDYGFLNDWEVTPQHAVSGDSVPHRVTATVIAQVPVGHGRTFGSGIPRWLDGIIGGWQTGVVFQAQSGQVLSWGDVYYNGDPTKLRVNLDPSNIARGGGFDSKGNPINGQVFDVSGFYPSGGASCQQQLGSPAPAASGLCYNDPLISLSDYHLRTFPRVLPNFRRPGQNNWDINAVKKFRVTEAVTYELRADFLNAFNHPWFDKPNQDPTSSSFGRITGQRNLPRNVQIGMKLTF